MVNVGTQLVDGWIYPANRSRLRFARIADPRRISDLADAGWKDIFSVARCAKLTTKGTQSQMLMLIIGLILFLGIHLVPTSPDLRNGLARRFGDNGYKIIFSVLSLIGLVVIVMGYHKLQINPGKNVVLWDSPNWLKHITWLLMIPAMIALAAAYIPSRIRTVLKHPMLVAVKLWALSHLIVNGDLGSLILFGAFLAFAVYDRISVKRRGALGPLGAAQGGLGGDIAAIAVGLGLYAFMLHMGHGWLIGVPLLPA